MTNASVPYELETLALEGVKRLYPNQHPIIKLTPDLETPDTTNVEVYQQQWVTVGKVVNERALVLLGIFDLGYILRAPTLQ